MGNGYTEFQQRCLDVIRLSQPGDVMSFGDVAHDAGNPGASRAVGALLSSSPPDTPWWRVMYADGRLPPCAPQEQTARLRAEGVDVSANRVRHPHFGTTRSA
jgi:methylated-DNA-protein-cysteine methyltransferase related protein